MQLRALILSLTILILTTLSSVSKAETATSGNLLPNAGDGVNTNTQNPNSTIDGIDSSSGFTLDGITDFSQSYNELEAQGTGTVSASGSLLNLDIITENAEAHTTTENSLDGGVTLNATTEVQNCEWSGSSYQCGQATPGRDSYSTTVKILDENDNVLAITTMTRNNDSGYRQNTHTYTDTITYTDTGSRKWDWQWQGIDGNDPNATGAVGPNLLGASLTATLLNINYTPVSEETEEQLEDTNELLELAQEDLENLLENLEEVNLEQLQELQFETPILQEIEIEEIKLEELSVNFEETFKEILIEENLIEEFETALIEENITEEEFFEEVGNIIEEEFEELMPMPTAMKEEEIQMEEFKEEEISNEEEITANEEIEESPQEENLNEEVKEETTETESNANTETNAKTEDNSEETMETSEEGKTSNEESNMDENTETEGSETETDTTETMEDTADSNDTQEAEQIDSINVKVKKIIEKLEKTLKSVDDKVKAVQFVTLKGIQSGGANLSSYSNIKLKDTIKLNDGNPDFFNQLNIEQEQIYKNKSLNAYTNNDPISIKQTELQRIDIEKKQLLLELKLLREG